MRYGFKISGCFGDVLYSTPVLKYLSKYKYVYLVKNF